MKKRYIFVSVLMAILSLNGCSCERVSDHVHTYSKYTFDASKHWFQCSCGAVKDVEEHTLEYKYDKEYHWYVCKCGYKSEKTPHSLEYNGNNEFHWLECSCGYKKDGMSKHSNVIKYDDNKHWELCTVCGLTFGEHEHYYDYAATTSKHHKECYCGKALEEEEHTFVEAYSDSFHWEECSTCKIVKNRNYHVMTQKYNDEMHFRGCEDCAYEDLERGERHRFNEEGFDKENHWKKCSACECKTDITPHEIEYEISGIYHYAYCLSCRYEGPLLAHEFVNKTDGEYVWNECKVCKFKTEKVLLQY